MILRSYGLGSLGVERAGPLFDASTPCDVHSNPRMLMPQAAHMKGYETIPQYCRVPSQANAGTKSNLNSCRIGSGRPTLGRAKDDMFE